MLNFILIVLTMNCSEVDKYTAKDCVDSTMACVEIVLSRKINVDKNEVGKMIIGECAGTL